MNGLSTVKLMKTENLTVVCVCMFSLVILAITTLTMVIIFDLLL